MGNVYSQNGDSIHINISLHQIEIPSAGLSFQKYFKTSRELGLEEKFYRNFSEFVEGRDTTFSWSFANLEYQRRKIKDDNWIAIDPWKNHYLPGYEDKGSRNPKKWEYSPSASIFLWSSQPLRDSLYWDKPLKKVLQSFLVSKFEVSNDEYRRFTQYVKDSIARSILARHIPDKYMKTITESGDTLLNWRSPFRYYWHPKDKLAQQTAPLLKGMFLPEHERFYMRKEVDTRLLVYDFGNKSTIQIYPDTMAWYHDFQNSESSFELYENYYYHISGYGLYPVSGVSKAKALAYFHWKNKHGSLNLGFSLPNWHEWYYANIAGVGYQCHRFDLQTNSKFLLSYNELDNAGQTNFDAQFQSGLISSMFYLYPKDAEYTFSNNRKKLGWNRDFRFWYTKEMLEQAMYPNGLMHTGNNFSEWLLDEGEHQEGVTFLIAGNNALNVVQSTFMGKNYPNALDYRFMEKDTANSLLGFREVLRFDTPNSASVTLGEFTQTAHAQELFALISDKIWYSFDVLSDKNGISGFRDSIKLRFCTEYSNCKLEAGKFNVFFDESGLRIEGVYSNNIGNQVDEDQKSNTEADPEISTAFPKANYGNYVLEADYVEPTLVSLSSWKIDPILGKILIEVEALGSFVFRIEYISKERILLVKEG
jgi:formylglycine-generating enzyme required for sulfatase activity